MQHIFILNPAAGKTRRALDYREQIDEYANTHPDFIYEIHVTASPKDATAFVHRRCEESAGKLRFYALGGDGTLSEVYNGMAGYSHAELASLPCGSANDCVKCFDNSEQFTCLPLLINGTARSIDAMTCNGKAALNLASLGLDADVAERMTKFKYWPLVSGSMAYNLAVIASLFHRLGHPLDITIEDECGRIVSLTGTFLFALAANGRYYGGGYHAAPSAVAWDGLLDFVMIQKVSRLRILRLLKVYKAGRHIDLPICRHFQGRRMTVKTPKAGAINLDGEVLSATEAVFEIRPNALNFVFPAPSA